MRPTEATPAPATSPGITLYDITFTADASCTALPADVRSRTYQVALGANAPAVLTGAKFGGGVISYPGFNMLYTRLPADGPADLFFQDPEIWELLSDDSYLTIFGDAHGQIGPATTTLSFRGQFTFCAERKVDLYPECEQKPVTCESRNHQLTLQRH